MRLKKDLIKKVEEITLTNYNFNEKGETDNWDVLVEDLIMYYEDLKKEYDESIERLSDKRER